MDTAPNLKHVIIGGLVANPDPTYIHGVVRRITEIKSKGIQVSVIKPHITRKGDLKNCYVRPFSPAAADCTLPISNKEQIDAGFAPLETAVRQEHPDVLFFNQNDIFCKSGKCDLVIDGMPIYRDQYSHLSEYASDEVARRFYDWAKAQGVDLSK